MGELPADALTSFAELFELRVYNNEALCHEGDETDKLWVLGLGRLVVVRSTESKGPFEVAQLEPTCLVGHSGLLGIAQRTATLRAKDAVEVLEMGTETARSILETHDSVAASAFRRALIVALSNQLRTSNISIGKLAVQVGVAAPDPDQILKVVPMI